MNKCEHCGYYDCQKTDRCTWSSENDNDNEGPYGVCKLKGNNLCNKGRVKKRTKQIHGGGDCQGQIPYFFHPILFTYTHKICLFCLGIDIYLSLKRSSGNYFSNTIILYNSCLIILSKISV